MKSELLKINILALLTLLLNNRGLLADAQFSTDHLYKEV